MNCIKPLLAKLAESAKPRLVSNGFACWLVYAQPLPDSFFQSLADIGGWSVVEDKNQSLWFFPSPEVLLGLAKLHNWARLHPMATAITIFESSLVVDEKLGQSLRLTSELSSLCADYPKRLVIRVSTKLREVGRAFTGLVFKQMQTPAGFTGEWFELEASEQVTVAYAHNWLWLIRPQGARQDKVFSKGWKAYFDRLESIFTQHKISYLHAEEQTLVLKVTSVRIMARLVTDLFALLGDKQDPAWPCQYMALEMGDHAFSPDFPSKVRHLFDPLESNALYLSLVTVFQIADPRIIPVDSRASLENSKITDLFQVQLRPEAGGRRRGSLNIFLPSALVSGSESPCFYCGLRSHLPRSCPSRALEAGNAKVTALGRFARIDLNALSNIFGEIEKQLTPNLVQGLSNLLMEKDNRGVVVSSIFEVNMVCQLRMMAMVWRAKGKEWPRGIEELRPQSEEHLWDALDAMRVGSPERAAEKLDQFVLKSSKSYQPRVLYGFLALERDELRRAAGFWEDAERLAYTGLQRSYLQLLRGRLCEISGDLPEAIRLYGRAFKDSPGFTQAWYRQAVCMVKSGYLNEAQATIRELIRNDPDYFSVALLDPELESGRSLFLSDLWEIWDEVQLRAREIIGAVEHLPDLLAKWLPEGHDDYRLFRDRINDLNTYAGINNYVSTAKLLQGAMSVRNDIQARVKKDIQELTARRKVILERLKEIQREASWFPFPSMLGGFNKAFNACGESLNLLSHLDLYVPDKFRQGHEAMRNAESLLDKLEKKLLMLQAVRNGILYMLLFGKYLLFYEIFALLLAGGVSMGLYFMGSGQTVLGRDLGEDRWLILNLLLIGFSFLAVVITAIQASAKFEGYKNRVLNRGGG